MQHLIILPILLPLLSGLLMLVKRDSAVLPRRAIALVSTALLLAVSAMLVVQSDSGDITYYALGDWQPPFGIILVLDRLSALMVCLTSFLALGSVAYACAGDDRKGSNFHGLFQLQLMGINGAFLTGDIFNLFVFFEVLLIASYSLLMHGGGKDRTQAGFHYVALNLAGSAMFLIALVLFQRPREPWRQASRHERQDWIETFWRRSFPRHLLLRWNGGAEGAKSGNHYLELN